MENAELKGFTASLSLPLHSCDGVVTEKGGSRGLRGRGRALLKKKKGFKCVDWINLFGLIKRGDTAAC